MVNMGLKMTGVVAELLQFSDYSSLPDSHTCLKAHVDELLKRTITICDVRILNCSKYEAWDGMWMLRQKHDDQPFVLVVEYKFREIEVERKAGGGKYTPSTIRPSMSSIPSSPPAKRPSGNTPSNTRTRRRQPSQRVASRTCTWTPRIRNKTTMSVWSFQTTNTSFS
jgi:hypothetical protein